MDTKPGRLEAAIALKRSDDPEQQQQHQVPEKETWGSKAEFILSCIGYSVGLGNIWRFPYVAYANGGGAFLLPYFILLTLVGRPQYFFEVAFGQFSGLGPVAVWRCAPIAKGVGVAMVMICVIVSIYYNVLMAYTVFYMGASFTSVLPWTRCNEDWTDQNCFQRLPDTVYLPTCDEVQDQNTICDPQKREQSAQQFWDRRVLGLQDSSGIHDIGSPRWELVLCLLFSWTITFLCLVKGVRSAGKVVYFTAVFPYVVLIALLIRGVTLEGASHGLYYLFVPDFNKLLEIKVWQAAAEQMFYSLGLSFGGLIMFGSYNQFKNKVHYDALLVSFVDFFTSIIGGVVIFSVLGATAYKNQVPIDKVAVSGPGLAFVAYPEALAQLPIPQLWSVLFFIMLFTLGLDSQFGMIETILSAIYDAFPPLRRYKAAFCGGVCSILFLLGLPCVCNGGIYVFEIMDSYGGGTGLLLVAVCEMVAVFWIYGVNRFRDDIQFMLGFRPSAIWGVAWVVTPVVLMVIFILAMTQKKPAHYGDEIFPDWAQAVAWMLALLSVIQVPAWAIVGLVRSWKRGNMLECVKPTADWGPGDMDYRQAYRDMIDDKSDIGIDNPALYPSTITLNLDKTSPAVS